MNQLGPVLERLLEEVVPIREASRWEFQRRWRTTFAPQVESWDGPLRDCCWHAISYGLLPSLRGADATRAFEQRVSPGGVLVATEEPSLTLTYRVVSTRALSYNEMSATWLRDLYLISEDWSWSFVMTHEQAILGPYFVEGLPDAQVSSDEGMDE